MGILDAPSLQPNKRGQQAIETQNAAALTRFNLKLGDIANTPTDILFIGHSIAEGFSSTKYANRFADSAVNALRRRMGVTGGIGHKKAVKSFGATDYPITGTGTLLTVSDMGIGGSAGAHLGTSQWTAMTIAVPTGHTNVDIVWSRGSGYGSFTYTLDGGAASAPIDTSGASAGYMTTRIAVNPASAHTIVLNPSAGICRIGGATFFAGDETKGIRSWEGGRPSNTSSQYLANAINSNNRWMDAIFNNQPSLVVVTLLCNDYISVDQNPGTNNVPVATTKTNLKAIVDAIAAKCTVRPSVLLNIENQRNNIDSGLGPSKWADYVQAAYDLADAEGYAVFDYYKRTGSRNGLAAYQAGLLNVDTIHPSDLGHKYWGEALAGFLDPH